MNTNPWLGPLKEEYQSLLFNASDRSPKSILNRLTDIYLGRDSPAEAPDFIQKRLEGNWANIENHPFHTIVFSDPNFMKAWRLFHKMWRDPTSKMVNDRLAGVVFLSVVVDHVGFYHRLNSKKGKPPTADSKLRSQGTRATKRLQVLLSRGISMESYTENSQLRVLLESLRQQLAATRRKPYEGKDWRERWFVDNVARALLIEPGFRSVAILKHLSGMINFVAESSTFERRLSEVIATNAKRLSRTA